MKEFLSRIWNSPTFMTWGNLVAKSSNLIILLPIVLTRFSDADIVVWYLYFTIVSLQLIIDFGFLPTFTRLFSYAFSGLTISEIQNIKDNKVASGQINWDSLNVLFLATKKIYFKLAFVTFFLAITIGSWLVKDSINKASNIEETWIGWFMVIVIASFSLYANSFVSILLGINKVAVVQRFQMLCSISAVVSSAIAILIFESLFIGIIAFYFWFLINFLINFFLVKKYVKTRKTNNNGIINALIKETIWPTAWRSGLGVAMSMGLILISGMIVAKTEPPIVAASYMIALQMIRAISSFSQAPFYSHLPFLTQLYSKNKIELLIDNSKKRMQMSFFVFIVIFLTIGLSGDYLLNMIGSNAGFPERYIWISLGIAFFFERFGAMYLQLYTLTNHIIWHIANGITGVIMILFVLCFHSRFGVYVFPLSMCFSYILFYVPYVIRKAYKEFGLSFVSHEKNNFLLAFVLFILSCVLIIL